MSLRPRYSLLTLLVLTALVAGGVKLWHGPHQVVEQIAPDKELGYTYTRDWQGKKTFQGPFIIRLSPHGGVSFVSVSYFNNAQPLPYHYYLSQSKIEAPHYWPAYQSEDLQSLPLTAVEALAFRAAVDVERQRMDQPPRSGNRWDEHLEDEREYTNQLNGIMSLWEAHFDYFVNLKWQDFINR